TEDEHQMHLDKFIGWTRQDKERVSYQEGETVDHVWVKPENLQTFLEKEIIVPSQVTELKILFHLDDK
ncbi:NUDIX hydrolase, partial [Streptococcus pyogenes]